jgi:hypothetical protein
MVRGGCCCRCAAAAAAPPPPTGGLSAARFAYFGGKPRRAPPPGKPKAGGRKGSSSADDESDFLDDDDDDSAGGAPAFRSKQGKFGGKDESEEEGYDEEGDEDDDMWEVTDPWLVKVRDLLVSAAAALELPPNPLDHLTDLLGGASNVAEMTGRKGHLVKDANGKVQYVKRGEAAGVSLRALNVHERNAFMAGKKLIAIISEAASTGISLQADKRVGAFRVLPACVGRCWLSRAPSC